MILCSHAYSTLEGLSVLRFLHYGASLFSDLADCITLKQWKLCCMGWPRSPSKKDLLSSCWGMQSLYGLQLSVHSGIIWVALPKITPLPWWFKGMIVLPHVGPAPSFFLMLLIIVLLSSPVAYWTPSDLGAHFPVSYLFAFSYCYGVLVARILAWCAIPFSSGSCFVRTLHYEPSVLDDPAQHGS